MRAGQVSRSRSVTARVVLCAAAAVLAGCGEDVVAPTTPPMATHLSLPMMVANPGARGVVVNDPATSAASTYTVALVDGSGRTSASVRASRRGIDSSGDTCVLARLPAASASARRVFYLDGDTALRYLDPDGSSGAVRRLGADGTTEVAFSVSPDESRVAVATFAVQHGFVHEEMRVEDLDGTASATIATHDVTNDGTGLISWPAGWHAGSLLVAMGLPLPQASCHTLAAITGYDLIDPSTATRRMHLCTTTIDASPSGLPTAAGVLCTGHDTAARPVQAVESIETWAGAPAVLARSLCGFSGDLSPDGLAIAATVNGQIGGACGPGDGRVHMIGRAGGDTVLGAAGTPIGWIDPAHLLLSGGAGMLALEVSSGRITPVAAAGDLEAVLPGGLG